MRNTVSLPLTKLINKSVETGIFPDICKVANVVPTSNVKQGYFAIIIDFQQ